MQKLGPSPAAGATTNCHKAKMSFFLSMGTGGLPYTWSSNEILKVCLVAVTWEALIEESGR